MQAVVTAFVTVVFVVMSVADRFACPDGCTDETPAAAQHTISSCALCHGWSHAPVVVAVFPAHSLIVRQLIVVTLPTDPDLPTAELPPKAA